MKDLNCQCLSSVRSMTDVQFTYINFLCRTEHQRQQLQHYHTLEAIMWSFVEQGDLDRVLVMQCLTRFDVTIRFTFQMACEPGGLWLIWRVQQLPKFFFPVQLLTVNQFLYCTFTVCNIPTCRWGRKWVVTI